MTTTNLQQQQFQDRLSRISRPPVEPEPIVTPRAITPNPGKKRTKRPPTAVPHWTENIGYPLRFVQAFLIGVLAVFVSRYVRFHLMGGALTGEDADLMMMLDGGVALAAAFAIKELFRIKGKEFAIAQTVGVFSMVVLMHNLAHMAPGTMGMVFSPEWVEEVTLYTEPKSILFRGNSFVIGEPMTTEAVMPTVRSMDSDNAAGVNKF